MKIVVDITRIYGKKSQVSEINILETIHAFAQVLENERDEIYFDV